MYYKTGAVTQWGSFHCMEMRRLRYESLPVLWSAGRIYGIMNTQRPGDNKLWRCETMTTLPYNKTLPAGGGIGLTHTG